MSLMPQIANPIGHSHEDIDVSFNVLHNSSPMRGVSNWIGHSHRAIDAHFSVLRGELITTTEVRSTLTHERRARCSLGVSNRLA